MINYESLFSISYGLYIVSSGNKEKGNGFVSNTVFQVSSSPAKFAACCSKNNHSAGIISDCGAFSVSVLRQDADAGLIGKFGYKSGTDVDKMEGTKLHYGQSGVPIVLDSAIAFLECKVVETIDVGSHLMFIAELVDAQVLEGDADALTYKYYRQVKKGVAPKNAPTYVDKSNLETKTDAREQARYECAACGYIYDEEKENKAFEELPEEWTCPVCGAEKEDFFKQ